MRPFDFNKMARLLIPPGCQKAPYDCFLWGHLKTKVYTHRPHNIEKLKTITYEKMSGIPMEILHHVMGNMSGMPAKRHKSP
jgi:hypothetical protein